jgi:hypothetical protein
MHYNGLHLTDVIHYDERSPKPTKKRRKTLENVSPSKFRKRNNKEHIPDTPRPGSPRSPKPTKKKEKENVNKHFFK